MMQTPIKDTTNKRNLIIPLPDVNFRLCAQVFRYLCLSYLLSRNKLELIAFFIAVAIKKEIS